MSESAEVYARFKAVFGGRTSSYTNRRKAEAAAANGTDAGAESSQPFSSGRDPVRAGAAFGAVAQRFGWETPLAQAELLSAWTDIAGAETAGHATPMHIDEGTLVIQCDSTAWATQLRGMRSLIITRIAERFPGAHVDAVQFLNPGAPSWKRGLRSVPGRGPRDTYG